VGVALLAVLALGHIEWTSYAAFGAFTSLYGRNQVPASRLKRQLVAAGALTSAVTAGAAVSTLADRDSWLVVGAGVVAFLGSALVAMEEWRPPGPTFPVFAFGAVCSVAHRADQVAVALAVSGCSAALAVVLGNARALLRVPPRAPIPLRRTLTWHPVLASVAVVLAGTVSTVLGIGHPYWSMVAAVAIVTGRNTRHRLQRAGHRVAGSMLGLVTAAALLAVLTDRVAVVLAVAALQLLTEVMVARNYALALLFITPQALLMGQLAEPRPVRSLLLDRGAETMVGAAAAVCVVVLGPLLLRSGGRTSAR
jgi:hypothetical protein